MSIAKNMDSWRHKSGYRLNGDGKSIVYEHIERQLLAIVEASVNEGGELSEMEYHTMIYDTNSAPWESKVVPETWSDKNRAMARLEMHMEYYDE